MKRDMDLIRRLLLEIEQRSDGFTGLTLKLEGVDRKTIGYHLKIMNQGKLVHAYEGTSSAGLAFRPAGLTWDGHEFLDKIRDESTWTKAKAIAVEKGAGLSFDVLKALVTKFAVDAALAAAALLK